MDDIVDLEADVAKLSAEHPDNAVLQGLMLIARIILAIWRQNGGGE